MNPPPPGSGLHCARHLQRQLARICIRGAVADPALPDQSQQRAIRRDDVEPVVMDPDMRHVRRHPLTRAPPAGLQVPGLARGLILE
jgi:hypothetical protein